MNSWKRLRELMAIQNKLSQLFNDQEELAYPLKPLESSIAMPTDIAEDAHMIYIILEIPGVAEKDISLTYNKRYITISGKKEFPEVSADDKVLRMERSYGTFTRSFMINEDIEENSISATLKEGVLVIEVPKSSHKTEIKIEA